MNGIYLGIGGNEGNRAEYLAQARALIAEQIGPIQRLSSIYQTAAWGNTKQQDFYNQVLFVRSDLSALKCLNACLKIEQQLGRERKNKWGSRTIDLDILFYNQDHIKKKNLSIPHPHLHERNFVLIPMNEIAPHFIHPVLRKKIFTLVKNTQDKLPVKKVT